MYSDDMVKMQTAVAYQPVNDVEEEARIQLKFYAFNAASLRINGDVGLSVEKIQERETAIIILPVHWSIPIATHLHRKRVLLPVLEQLSLSALASRRCRFLCDGLFLPPSPLSFTASTQYIHLNFLRSLLDSFELWAGSILPHCHPQSSPCAYKPL